MVEYSNPASLAAPLGAYSHLAQAVPAGIVAVAGQVAVDPAGDLVGEDIEAQVPRAFENVRIALGEAGLSWGDVLQLTTYLVDRSDIGGFFRARASTYEDWGIQQPPPNTLLVVDGLVDPTFRVEIQALAIRS